MPTVHAAALSPLRQALRPAPQTASARTHDNYLTGLQKMLEIQRAYLRVKWNGQDYSDTVIFKEWIQPLYGITRSEFEKILARNVKKELRALGAI